MVVGLVVAAVGGYLALRPAADGVDAARAPDFTIPDLRDPERTVSLADFRGRPVVVNFFAAWCVPCREELPELVAAAERYEGRVAFVGIDFQDSRNQALDLVDEFDVTYPAGSDTDGAVGARFGVRGMPLTVFVDAEGIIRHRVDGKVDATALEEGIEAATAGVDAAGPAMDKDAPGPHTVSAASRFESAEPMRNASPLMTVAVPSELR